MAEYLSVSQETVHRRARAGELPAIRVASNALRFREPELEAFVERGRGSRRAEGVAQRSGDRCSLRPAHRSRSGGCGQHARNPGGLDLVGFHALRPRPGRSRCPRPDRQAADVPRREG
ncbi:MAG: helix-turn-helix domain-containing protein [Gaiellaceae bacterium]